MCVLVHVKSVKSKATFWHKYALDAENMLFVVSFLFNN